MIQKTWFITGVSKGLGKVLAEKVSGGNDFVIGTVRNEKDKSEFEKEPNRKAVIIDLEETAKIPDIIKEALAERSQIDVLVNSAGYGAFGMIEEFTEQEIRKQFEVNFIAVWKLCQSVLPEMRHRKEGVIVQISSRMGIEAGIGNGIYAAGKFALEAMSESLKAELEPFGIKILLVEPGAMRTDFFGRSVLYAEKEIEDYKIHLADIRKKTKAVHGEQKGDPSKVAGAIIQSVQAGVPEFRLPLTEGSITTLLNKSEALKNTAEVMKDLAVSVDVL